MFTRPALASAIAAAALVVFAAPAAAQHGTSASVSAPRVLARYSLSGRPGSIAFPSTIVVADSAGQLVASAKLSGELSPVPMTVAVIEKDLVLEAVTPDGVLTVVLDDQAEGGARKVYTGRWSLGKAEGQLRARG
jgi:hypothetical protein